MKKTILILFIFISNYNFSQNGFADWDENYKLVNPENIIQAEIEYARKVEKDTTIGQYYVAMNSYRFIAKYTGNERQIDANVLNSMKNVLKIRTGSYEVLNDLVSMEFEFNIGKTKIWMPIQNQLIEHLKNELKPGQEVLLYCLFTNEGKFEGDIINTFLISEFTTEWE